MTWSQKKPDGWRRGAQRRESDARSGEGIEHRDNRRTFPLPDIVNVFVEVVREFEKSRGVNAFVRREKRRRRYS